MNPISHYCPNRVSQRAVAQSPGSLGGPGWGWLPWRQNKISTASGVCMQQLLYYLTIATYSLHSNPLLVLISLLFTESTREIEAQQRTQTNKPIVMFLVYLEGKLMLDASMYILSPRPSLPPVLARIKRRLCLGMRLNFYTCINVPFLSKIL